MAKSKTDRSAQITIRLEPKILDGLREISERIGIAPTTLAGAAIGEYVAKSQASFDNQAKMSEAMATEMARVIGQPLAALFDGKTAEELKELFKDD